ncbi:DUF6207 family protein [Streptomyces sp. NPDC059991]|uniref:DUF6207 family protein n=1 Tax=Streptomyces sp. NPDC059991 TaxID=3347028 RepID=UPI0036853D66
MDEQHIAEPVLAVTAADEDTTREVMGGLQQRWSISGITHMWRVPGEPGGSSCTGSAGRNRGSRHLRRAEWPHHAVTLWPPIRTVPRRSVPNRPGPRDRSGER